MSDGKKESLWTRDFILVWIVAMLLRICMQIKSTTLPLYVISLEYTKSAAGLTTTAYTLAALVFRPIVGNVIDRQGRRHMLLMGAGLVAITMLPFALVTDIRLMYVLQITSGIGFSIQSVALSTMTTDLLPERRLTEGLGYYGLTSTISQAVAPALALGLIGSVGYGWNFVLSTCFCVGALALAVFICYEKKRFRELAEAPEKILKEEPERWWHKIVEPHALIPGLLMAGVAFTTASIGTFLPTFGAERVPHEFPRLSDPKGIVPRRRPTRS